MALNDAQFIQKIIALQDDMIQVTDYESGKQQYAEGLLAAVKSYIKSGQVVVNVQTTGTSSSQTGTGTGSII